MRLPAEWEKQGFIQLTWPHPVTEWYELPKVLDCYVNLASAIVRYEPLLIVCHDEAACREDFAARGVSIEGWPLRLVQVPINDTWARDHGAISVWGDQGEKCIEDFVFNGWGLKFGADMDNQITRRIYQKGAFAPDVKYLDMRPYVLEGGSIDTDGEGTLLTTRSCLCSVNRNEYLSQAQVEEKLKAAFGLKRILWLENGSIDGDDTDSHVDILARFCSRDTIAYSSCEDPSSPNYEPLRRMEAELRSFRTLDGQPYKLVPLPLPEQLWLEDYPLPASYANFLIVNGGVLVPGAGSPSDETARERLQALFPDRKVEIINCRALLSGHGGLHCITMNFPEGW